MKMDTRNNWYSWLGVGATAATIAAGVAIYSAGPATADCSTLHVRDDAGVLDASAMQGAANACPQVPALAWTTNKDAGSEASFTNDVKSLVGPSYPMVIGHNPNSNYTTVQVDPGVAGITQDQANAAASYATTMFNSTYSSNQNNSTNAMLAAVRSLNSSIAADHGRSGMVAPAPGNNGMNGNGMNNNGSNSNGLQGQGNGENNQVPVTPGVPPPSMNVAPPPAPPPVPSLNNPLPSIAPPTVTTPTTTNNGLTGWEIFWCVVGPLLVLAALGLLLWRFLAGRRHRRALPPPAQTYTRPVGRTAAEPVDTTTTTTTATAATTEHVRDVGQRPAPTTPMPPVREEVTPVRPAMTGEPVHGTARSGSLVSYEVREADGSRQEFHYVDPEGRGSTEGEWIDQRGVPEADNNQSWWRPGVRDTGNR